MSRAPEDCRAEPVVVLVMIIITIIVITIVIIIIIIIIIIIVTTNENEQATANATGAIGDMRWLMSPFTTFSTSSVWLFQR